MKSEIAIQNQITAFKNKLEEVHREIKIATILHDDEELLILEMQTAEIKGIIKALEWTLK